MYARVQYKNKTYYSYVFAHFKYDYMPHYIVFDPIDEKFDIIAYFSKSCDGHRQIGFMNEDESEFVRVNGIKINKGQIDKCDGYDWLVKNVDLIKAIEEGKSIDQKYVEFAKKLNATINPDAWNEVETEEDAENMMNHVGGFHDWYLISITAISDPYTCELESKVQLKFSSQAAFDTLVEFDGAFIKYNFCPANRIYLSSVVIDGDIKYWVDGEEELSIEDVKNYDHIAGTGLRWKFVLKEEDDW